MLFRCISNSSVTLMTKLAPKVGKIDACLWTALATGEFAVGHFGYGPWVVVVGNFATNFAIYVCLQLFWKSHYDIVVWIPLQFRYAAMLMFLVCNPVLSVHCAVHGCTVGCKKDKNDSLALSAYRIGLEYNSTGPHDSFDGHLIW